MQRKNKFLMQHSTPPDFKIKLANFLQANVYQTVYLPPSGGPILSSPAKKESGKKDAAKGGGGPPPLDLTPVYGVDTTAAHCTGYQTDLRVHPSPDGW